MPLFVPRAVRHLAAAAAVCFGAVGRVDAAPEPVVADASRAADEQAIRTASLAYQQALERGDGKALAALWTPDGDIVDAAGHLLRGRDSVGALEPADDDGKPAARPSITIHDVRIRFVSADVAIEDGTVEVGSTGHAAPLHGHFSATWVKRDEGWRLAAVREARIDAVAGRGQLADLEWMVGDWVAVDEGAAAAAGATAAGKPAIRVSARWNPTKTFLVRETTITPQGTAANAAPALQITQRIGWDPLSRSIRSWVFSSDGGHGEATWTRDDGSWVARTAAVLPDGTQTSSLNIYSYDGKDRCSWRSIPTHVGGEHMPHVNMTLVRVPSPSPTGGADR